MSFGNGHNLPSCVGRPCSIEGRCREVAICRHQATMLSAALQNGSPEVNATSPKYRDP